MSRYFVIRLLIDQSYFEMTIGAGPKAKVRSVTTPTNIEFTSTKQAFSYLLRNRNVVARVMVGNRADTSGVYLKFRVKSN